LKDTLATPPQMLTPVLPYFKQHYGEKKHSQTYDIDTPKSFDLSRAAGGPVNLQTKDQLYKPLYGQKNFHVSKKGMENSTVANASHNVQLYNQAVSLGMPNQSTGPVPLAQKYLSANITPKLSNMTLDRE
jgi:hypothetical protein